jgi:hypothetical protein
VIGAALIPSLLPAAAFLAVFVAGLFARSVVEHELEIWRRSHPHHRSRRPGAPGHDYYAEALELQAARAFQPITAADLEQAERDAELQTLIVGGWPSR